jgi:hypothetical protein
MNLNQCRLVSKISWILTAEYRKEKHRGPLSIV